MPFKLTPVHFECGRPGNKDNISVGEPDIRANESLGDIQGRKKASRTACERIGMRPHNSKGGLGERGRGGKAETEKA